MSILTPGLWISHVNCASPVRQTDAFRKVCFSDVGVIGLLLAVDHRQITKYFSILRVLLKRRFKAVLGGSQVVLLPIDMSKSIPCFPFRRQQFQTLAEEILSLASILWQEVERPASQIQELCFLFLVCHEVDRFGVEKCACCVKIFTKLLHSITTEIAAIELFKLCNYRTNFLFNRRVIYYWTITS